MPSSLLSWPLPSRPPIFRPATKLRAWLRPAVHLGAHAGMGVGVCEEAGAPAAHPGPGQGAPSGTAHSVGWCRGGGGGKDGVGCRVSGTRGTSSAPRCTFHTRILRKAKLHSRDRARRAPLLPRSSVPAPLPGLFPEHPSLPSTHPLPNPCPARGAC